MSITPTPETDGQYKEYARRDNNVKCVDIDFARKLERERDAARSALSKLVDLAAELTTAVETWKAQAERTCRVTRKFMRLGFGYCVRQCGIEVPVGEKSEFCPGCGGQIVEEEQQPKPPQP